MRMRTCLAALLMLCTLAVVSSALGVVSSALGEEALTEGQFSDLCADANAAEVKEAITKLDNAESVSIIPFMVAAANNPDPEVIEVLLEFFGKEVINQTFDDSGKTALIWAVQSNNSNTGKRLRHPKNRNYRNAG